MFDFLVQTHNQFFFLLHNLLDHFPRYQDVTYIIAEKIDIYVVILSILVFIYFIYQSAIHTSWKRFVFLVKELTRIIIAIICSWSISYVVKMLTAFPRPFLKYPDKVSELFTYGGFDSFPSGHATLFMALGVMMSLHHRRVGYVFIFFAVLISFARVISGVHFPIDIIIGWVIGSVLSLLLYRNLKLS